MLSTFLSCRSASLFLLPEFIRLCFGPHALKPVLWNPEIVDLFVDLNPLFRIIVTLFSVPGESLLIKSKKI
jgi:hypothetical protein